jgi:hypothetical protein
MCNGPAKEIKNRTGINPYSLEPTPGKQDIWDMVKRIRKGRSPLEVLNAWINNPINRPIRRRTHFYD